MRGSSAAVTPEGAVVNDDDARWLALFNIGVAVALVPAFLR